MNIFEFDDYKRFLRHFIETQPKKGRGVVKALGEYLGIDPSQVSQVLSGGKDFTEEQGMRLSQYIGLSDLGTEYFLILLQIERAGSKDLRQHYLRKRDQIKKTSLNVKEHIPKARELSDYEKSVFYSSYVYSAIRLSTSIGQGLSMNEIVARFDLPRDRVTKIVQFLLSTNLCREQGGRYVMGEQMTHIDRSSPLLLRHHHNWRVKALERSENLSEQELQFTGPVSLSAEDFQKIRSNLVEVINKSIETVKKSEASDVACLLIDWFWVSPQSSR